MARPKKETHLFFEQGADEIQIRSWDKDLNAAVMRLKTKHPDAVWIREKPTTNRDFYGAPSSGKTSRSIPSHPDRREQKRRIPKTESATRIT